MICRRRQLMSSLATFREGPFMAHSLRCFGFSRNSSRPRQLSLPRLERRPIVLDHLWLAMLRRNMIVSSTRLVQPRACRSRFNLGANVILFCQPGLASSLSHAG